jgi:hypothetical protein
LVPSSCGLPDISSTLSSPNQSTMKSSIACSWFASSGASWTS